LLMVALGAGLWLVSGRSPAGSSAAAPLLIGLPPLMLLGAYLLGSAWRAKLVLTEDAIELHGLFRVRRLGRSDIAGRRMQQLNYGQTMTELVPNIPGTRPLKFSQSSMRSDALLDAWVSALPDLDARDAQASEAEIAADGELGQTPGERLARLAQAKRVAKAFNALTWGAALWGFFYPQPYAAAVLVAAILPWAAIALVAKSGGLYRLDRRRNDVRPNLASALYLPGFVLLMRAVQDVGVLDWQRPLVYGALIAVVLCWAALRADATVGEQRITAAVLFALACVYGWGAVVLTNSELDRASGSDYRVQVFDRHYSRGSRSTSYYLRLAPWGPRRAPQDVSVPRGLYASAPPGSVVCIHQGPGALGIPWYVVRACS